MENIEDVLRVTVESNLLKVTLNNRMVRKVHHEKELLNNSYVQTLERHVPKLVNPMTGNSSLEKRLRSLCTTVESQYKRTKGRNKPKFLQEERNVTVKLNTSFPAETCDSTTSRDDVASEALLHALQRKIDQKTAEANELKDKVSELNSTVEQLDARNDLLSQANENLSSSLTSRESLLNKGKKVGEGSKKTDQRKLKVVAEGIATSLDDLLSSFGLSTTDIFVEDLKGLLHKISYDDSGHALVQAHVRESFRGGGITSYKDLCEGDKKVVREVAMLLDEHRCSNIFWQELSRSVKGLPSITVINSYRQSVDERLEITKTPGAAPGAQVSFRKEIENAIQERAKQRRMTLRELSTLPLTIKIEGDGSRISRKKSWTTLSFLVIEPGKQLQAHKLHRLLAVVEISENYFSVRRSLGHLVVEINSVIDSQSILVHGISFQIRVCLGSDLKFLLVLLGLQSASSKFPCPFCRADPKERSNLKLPSQKFNEAPLARTLENLRSDCDALSHGVQYATIFQIEPAQIVPDVLHMRMRILNRLLDCLLIEMEDFDCEAKVLNRGANNERMVKFIALVNSCGVKFDVWDDERKGRAFTSLPGNDCQKLLEHLPDKLKGQLHQDTELSVIFLWTTFRDVLKDFESDTTGKDVEKKARAFFRTFIELEISKRKGYGKDRITPYIHIFAHHAPAKHVLFQCLGWYSSQGLEKKNDVLKGFHHGRSNKWSAEADALTLAKRSEVFCDGPSARGYVKSDTDYWQRGGIQESRKKRQRSAPEAVTDHRDLGIESMSAGQLRTELQSFGRRTTVKCPAKLRDMLRKVMKNPS